MSLQKPGAVERLQAESHVTMYIKGSRTMLIHLSHIPVQGCHKMAMQI